MPPGVCRMERQEIGDLQRAQPVSQAAILAVEAISYHRTERPLEPSRLLDKLQGDFALGAKSRIMLALGKIARLSCRARLPWGNGRTRRAPSWSRKPRRDRFTLRYTCPYV